MIWDSFTWDIHTFLAQTSDGSRVYYENQLQLELA